jgi:hypothetical protein
VPFQIVNLTCDPPAPKAGDAFTLTVQITATQNSDVKVTLEKQRIVSNSGTPELRPTGPNYFASGFDPLPITVMAGSATGASQPIKVRKDASADTGDPPVIFPEHALFTAFDDRTSMHGTSMHGFFPLIVPILKPGTP